MAKGLIEKVCPVILRGAREAPEILVFRHPLAGVQLVKGTREVGEAIVTGALRELAEESGIVDFLGSTLLCSSSSIASGQLWHFVLVQVMDLPERWGFNTVDDGGHRFEFFWVKLDAAPNLEWHPDFVRAQQLVREAVNGAAPEAAEMLWRYAELINNHNFDDVAPLIADDAVFWFGDGSNVGVAAIRQAFEATWRRFHDETYWLEDFRWIATGAGAASCIYRFCWRATVDGQEQSGQGRGTTVLRNGQNGWQIVHEHLSALPADAQS